MIYPIGEAHADPDAPQMRPKAERSSTSGSRRASAGERFLNTLKTPFQPTAGNVYRFLLPVASNILCLNSSDVLIICYLIADFL